VERYSPLNVASDAIVAETLAWKLLRESRHAILPIFFACLNQDRRSRTAPLTNTEKRARVAAELKADPACSDAMIAQATGTTHPFVGKVRKELEESGW
jgi:hypothetical protein